MQEPSGVQCTPYTAAHRLAAGPLRSCALRPSVAASRPAARQPSILLLLALSVALAPAAVCVAAAAAAAGIDWKELRDCLLVS